MNGRKFALILLILALVRPDDGARILFFVPMSTHSERHFFSPVYTELVNRGHHVTLVTNEAGKVSHPNITEIVPCSYDETYGLYRNAMLTRDLYWFCLFDDMSPLNPVFDKIYTNPQVQNLLSQKFDLIFINSFIGQVFLGIVHKLQAPFIALHSLSLSNHRGISVGYHMPHAHIPNPFIGFSDNMNFYERTMNFLIEWAATLYAEVYHFGVMESAYRKHLGDDVPSIKEIERKQQSLIITNTHYITNYHRPLMPDVIEVCGIHCQPAKPLSDDLEDLLNEKAAPEGFIFFSLGTVLSSSTVSDDLIRKFINVFSRQKQTVVWKWEGNLIENLPKNVILKKWLPQQDLLGHPNILLFISHGGLLSVQQSIYHSVPVILFPFWFDQVGNSKAVVEKGAGIMLDIWTMTEDQLDNAIKSVINKPEFKRNMATLSSVFRNEINDPLEKAIHWIEHVLQFKGAPHLRSSARDLNLFQQHSLDVVAFLILITTMTMFLVRMIFKTVLNLIKKECTLLNKNKRKVS